MALCLKSQTFYMHVLQQHTKYIREECYDIAKINEINRIILNIKDRLFTVSDIYGLIVLFKAAC